MTAGEARHALGVGVLGWPLLVLSPLPASATLIFVRTEATGASDGTSWADAYRSLRSALFVAQSGDEVCVAAGTYRPTKAGNSRTASFAAWGSWRPGLTVRPLSRGIASDSGGDPSPSRGPRLALSRVRRTLLRRGRGRQRADGFVDLTDSISLLSYLFRGDRPPAQPFPFCGTVPDTSFVCEAASACVR